MRKYFGAIAFAFLFAFFALLSSAGADNFPSRPITLIVPFPPGGSTDVAARIMADKMCAALGQVVIVENVGGAGGSIGVGRLARAAPDGYGASFGNRADRRRDKKHESSHETFHLDLPFGKTAETSIRRFHLGDFSSRCAA